MNAVHMVGPLRFHLLPGEGPATFLGIVTDPICETAIGFIVCGAPGRDPWSVVTRDIVDVTCEKCLTLLERAVFEWVPASTRDTAFRFLCGLRYPDGLHDVIPLIEQARDADPAALAVLADWFRERQWYGQIADMLDRCYRCVAEDDPAAMAIRKHKRDVYGYVERVQRQPGDPCPHARQLAILRRFFVPMLLPRPIVPSDFETSRLRYP